MASKVRCTMSLVFSWVSPMRVGDLFDNLFLGHGAILLTTRLAHPPHPAQFLAAFGSNR